MNDVPELDERVKPLVTKLKYAGLAIVAMAMSAVVIVGSISIIAAVCLGLVALAAVNFGIPVGARYIALKKQQALTALAETYSEETIREDERQEEERLKGQQRDYQTQSVEFQNIIDELSENMSRATAEERQLLQGQIDQLNGITSEAADAIKQKVADLVELKRLNGIYIAMHRAGKAMKNSQERERSAAEIQRVETARNAIKTRMREALAGQKLAAMSEPLRERLSVARVAQITSSPSAQIPTTVDSKETVRALPHRR